MNDFNRVTQIIDHGSLSYDQVMLKRLSMMKKIIQDHASSCCFWRTLSLNIMGDREVPRDQYNYYAGSRIYDYLKKRVPFRKDVVGVETLQFPDYTLSHGGDCDDLVILFNTIAEAGGVPTQFIIASMGGSQFDHVASFIPAVGVADLTYPEYLFPVPLDQYPINLIV